MIKIILILIAVTTIGLSSSYGGEECDIGVTTPSAAAKFFANKDFIVTIHGAGGPGRPIYVATVFSSANCTPQDEYPRYQYSHKFNLVDENAEFLDLGETVGNTNTKKYKVELIGVQLKISIHGSKKPLLYAL